tara:strand:+ start:51 stop:1157 length:1107 start_codon:yes stop_codon:yes gene_type:complete
MNKLLLLLLCVVFFAAGCGKGKKSDEATLIEPIVEKLTGDDGTMSISELSERSLNIGKLDWREGIPYPTKDSLIGYTGKVFELDEDGKLKQETSYRMGIKYGLEAGWHPNGEKKFEITYRNGFEIEGSFKYWNIKGKSVDSLEKAIGGINLKQTINRDGIRYQKGSNAPYTGKLYLFYEDGKYWDVSKRMRLESTFKNGKLNGLFVIWEMDGTKTYEAQYVNGKKDGLETSWYFSGAKRSEVTYVYEKKKSEKFWNPKGKPIDSLDISISPDIISALKSEDYNLIDLRPESEAEPELTGLITERDWTDIRGRTLTASLLDVIRRPNGSYYGKFKKTDGSEFEYEIIKLSTTDRSFIKKALIDKGRAID